LYSSGENFPSSSSRWTNATARNSRNRVLLKVIVEPVMDFADRAGGLPALQRVDLHEQDVVGHRLIEDAIYVWTIPAQVVQIHRCDREVCDVTQSGAQSPVDDLGLIEVRRKPLWSNGVRQGASPAAQSTSAMTPRTGRRRGGGGCHRLATRSERRSRRLDPPHQTHGGQGIQHVVQGACRDTSVLSCRLIATRFRGPGSPARARVRRRGRRGRAGIRRVGICWCAA
jgi:hypothetical protein